MKTLKTTVFIPGLLVVLFLSFAGTTLACDNSVRKYTFTAQLDAQPVTIYAHLKTVPEGDFTRCDYQASDQYLGHIEMPANGVVSQQDVYDFCVNNFYTREQ
jgi:hypothetical protein